MPDSFRIVGSLAALMLVLQVVNFCSGYSLNAFGILPRTLGGLPGVVIGPFLHGSFAHLASNLAGFVVLAWLVCAAGRTRFVVVSAVIVGLGGLMVWLLGRNSLHVGASGWIFGLWAYLVARAWYERGIVNLLVASGVIALYGGMVFGLLPARGVSVESHIAGAAAGLLAALLLHKRAAAGSAD